jgi:hypothetical protein
LSHRPGGLSITVGAVNGVADKNLHFVTHIMRVSPPQ